MLREAARTCLNVAPRFTSNRQSVSWSKIVYEPDGKRTIGDNQELGFDSVFFESFVYQAHVGKVALNQKK